MSLSKHHHSVQLNCLRFLGVQALPSSGETIAATRTLSCISDLLTIPSLGGWRFLVKFRTGLSEQKGTKIIYIYIHVYTHTHIIWEILKWQKLLSDSLFSPSLIKSVIKDKKKKERKE